MATKKKIVYISNARMPTEKAHGYQIVKTIEGFCNLEISVELVLPRRKNPLKDDLFSFYNLKVNRANLKIKRLPCLDFIQQDKYLGHFAFLLEIATYFISLFFYTLFKKADVFYTRDKVFLPLALIKKNIVLESHSFPKRYWLYRLYLKQLKAIIVLTKKLKEMFVEQGIKQEKLCVSPDGVDLNTFVLEMSKEQARQGLGLPLDKKIISYFGRFRTMGEEKGISEVLEALKILTAQGRQDIVFLAVGGSRQDVEFYQNKAEALGIVDKVILKERVSREVLAKYQKASDILLMPFPNTKHYAFYMSPLKMFEFMAAKRPIITSDLPSVREILSEQNAFLVQPENTEELAQKISFVLSNQDLAKQKAEQAFVDVKKYSWQKRAGNVLAFIR